MNAPRPIHAGRASRPRGGVELVRSARTADRPQLHEALRAAIARIGKNPKQFPPGKHETRRALLRRFPYLIIFREARRSIYVVGIFHTSRDPSVWQRRT